MTIVSKRYLLLLSILLSAFCTLGQKKDSLPARDTLDLYKKIKKVAYKHKVTRLIYQEIFTDPAPQSYEVKPLSDQQKTEDPNLKFNGKTIRKINIKVYDPFGHSVNDTAKKETTFLQQLGNSYHVTTRRRIIRNLLLFQPNDTLELIKISESERIIRAAGYINDARIYIESASGESSDSVDVNIFVQDKWALEAIILGDPSGGNVRLRDKNIIGLGQRFEQYGSYKINGDYELTSRYNVANISKSFVSSDIFYTTTKDLAQTGISLDRPFYSPLARWAGGVSGVKTWGTYKYIDTLEKVERRTALDSYNTDVWIARSISTGNRKFINKKISNIVVALRRADTRFQVRPSFLIDTGKSNLNTTLYLGSLGFSLSKYYKDQYIFRFGSNEDIPEGLIVQFLYGVLSKEQSIPRYYAGFDASRGKHYDKIGYFSANATYGTYFNTGIDHNATINLGLTYFTDLLRDKKWYYRQFVYLKYIDGFNKPSTEKITLRPDELYGFSNGSLTGKSKMLLNLEGVTYAPYNIVGFRFAPLALLGFGMLQPDGEKLFESRVYQSYAVGLLIRNENLLNSSFQITFGMYPYLPDNITPLYKFNPVTSFTVKVRSFSISKPSVISYE